MDTNIIRELRRIKTDIRNGVISTSGELTNRVMLAFSEYGPDIFIPKYAPSEPPSSAKLNYITRTIEKALRDREYTSDLLTAAAVYEYDEAMKMLDSLEDKVAGLGDSVKTLYFYSKPFRSNINVIGVDFENSWGFFRNNRNTMHLNIGGGLTLPVVRGTIPEAEVTIEGDGFAGAWYRVGDDGKLLADNSSNDKVAALLDSEPTTMYEYGRYGLSPEQELWTKAYGFGFSDSEFKWASIDYSDITMTLTMKLKRAVNTNYIVIQPSIAADQFTVKNVALLLGGVVQKTLEPQNLIVNQRLMMRYESGYANSAVYVFEPTLADEIQCKFYSNYPVKTKIRHFYSVDSDGNRTVSASPSTTSPHTYLTSVVTDDISKQEDLVLDRFYVGIKDISIQSNTYGTEGFAATPEPVKFGKAIDRVALTSVFSQPTGTKVKFEVSFDGMKWYTLSPLGTSLTNQIIAINDRVPGPYKDPSTTYISLDHTPTELWARISANRTGTGNEYYSPVVHNVQYEVYLKD